MIATKLWRSFHATRMNIGSNRTFQKTKWQTRVIAKILPPVGSSLQKCTLDHDAGRNHTFSKYWVAIAETPHIWWGVSPCPLPRVRAIPGLCAPNASSRRHALYAFRSHRPPSVMPPANDVPAPTPGRDAKWNSFLLGPVRQMYGQSRQVQRADRIQSRLRRKPPCVCDQGNVP